MIHPLEPTRPRSVPLLAVASLLLAALGCSRTPPATGEPAATVQVTADPGVAAAKGDANPQTAVDAKYTQSFAQAALVDEIPDDQQAPPDRTLTGRATGPMRLSVEALWPKIALTDVAGKPIPYVVTISTPEGEIDITLHPEWAPNHVRNWVALIKTGFYDGLCFDRVLREAFVDAAGQKRELHLIRGGCPLGTGEPGVGHLGYFLRPEWTPSLKHEAGTVGFWRDGEPASAGCRFYITLTPAETLDGEYTILGKVTRGLEVVRKIADRPVVNPTHEVDRERPRNPVTIQKITLKPDPVELTTPVAHHPDRETER